jgi:hypothetical protein
MHDSAGFVGTANRMVTYGKEHNDQSADMFYPGEQDI